MLIYAGIFAASFVAALLARLIYNSITNKYRSVHAFKKRAGITDNAIRYPEERAGFMTYGGIPNQPVQEGGVASSNPRNTHPAKSVVCHNQNATRFVREQKSLSMKGSYKVSRKVKSEPRTLETVSKPFKREVAPWAKDNKTATRSCEK